MSTWVADERGIWHPAKESVGLRNISNKSIVVEMKDDNGKSFKKTIPPGGHYVYEGPDRAALFQWWEENGKPSADKMKAIDGKVTMGSDFRQNTEFMEQYSKFRNMFGFNSIEEYLKYLGYDEKKSHERFEKNAVQVNTHELPARIEEIKKLGGGDDRATGENIRYGGFGTPPEMG